MDCLEFRRRLGAEPHTRDPALLAHRDGCAACAAAWERAQAFERELHAALHVPVPEGLADRILLAQATGQQRRHTRRRRFAFAMAASVLLVLGAGGFVWHQMDAHSLPALAVAHMPSEIQSLDATQTIAAAAIRDGFAGRGLKLRGPLPADITYVHDCAVGPYKTVHLVSRVHDMPVAVLYVPGKMMKQADDFHRDGWRGRMVPLQHGTLVMLTDRAGTPPFNAIARDWRAAIDGDGNATVANTANATVEPNRLAP